MPAAVVTWMVPTFCPAASGATSGSLRWITVFICAPVPLGTVTNTAPPGAPSRASADLPFHTGTVATGLPASNSRTASQACQPQFSSFWLSLARASRDAVPMTTDSSRRLPLGMSRWALATRQ